MLKQVKLTNFRKHTDLTIDFTSGLQVLRAANEGGKSTVTEGILYALYGSTLLRNSLDETVTWGQKPSSLRVELEIDLQGKAYTFTRSSAGAEVTHNGTVLVTGQKEVSAFAANLLGADGKAVQKLIFANQNSIRGALEEGPKAVATQIENLCDFDIFDNIIERMQEKLIIGSPSLLEARLREADEKVQAYIEPAKPSLKSMEAEIATSEKQLEALNKDLAVAEKEATAAFSLHQNAENAQRMHTTLSTNLRKHEEDLKLHQAQLAQAESKKAPDQKEIDGLKVQLADAEAHVRRLAVFQKLGSLSYPELFWEGDRAGFDAEVVRLQASIEANQGEVRAAEALVTEATTKVKTLRSKVITSLVCPTCRQEVKNKDEITLQNVRLDAEAAAVESTIPALSAEVKQVQRVVEDLKGELRELQALAKSALPFEQFAQQHGEFVEVDLNFVPPKLTWKGATPSSEVLDANQIKVRLSALEQQQDAARRAEGQAETLRKSIDDDLLAVERAREQLVQYPEVANVDVLKRDYNAKTAASIQLKVAIQEAQSRIATLRGKLETVMDEYEKEIAVGVALRASVKQAEEDLAKLAFNNTLLKKVRAIRPLVADKLWNQVLAAVSTMFSQIRGEKSVVTKDKDGFKVNGQSVESLSGSTLDALGVAIRTALVRTFLPHTTFAVLDEPASGCDSDRTMNLIGFLASAGFTQTLLITHDPISETFADNLITL